MKPESLVKIIESGDLKMLLLIVAIAIIQSALSLWIGERTKRAIKSEYDRNLEKYKNDLLQKKLIFEQQIDAYKEFMSIRYEIYPEKSFEEMDWDDAVQDIALGFKTHYTKFGKFLISHAAILPKEIKNQIEECWYLCSDGKFGIKDFEVSGEGFDAAKKLWEKIGSIENEFRSTLEIDNENGAN